MGGVVEVEGVESGVVGDEGDIGLVGKICEGRVEGDEVVGWVGFRGNEVGGG